MIAWGREERPPSLKRDGGVSAARSSGPQASPLPTTPELAPQPRDPVADPAADAFVLLFIPPALSLVNPALYLQALILVLLTPARASASLLAPSPVSPQRQQRCRRPAQRRSHDGSFSEDDRPRATKSALLSSPPPRTRRGGEGGAQNTRLLLGSRSRSVRCLRTVIPCRRRRRRGGAPAAAVSGRGGSGGIGSGGGDNDIGFGVSIVCMCGVCVSVRTCRLQHVAEQNVRHNHAYFYFWHGSCQTFFLAVKVPNFFLAAKTTFGSWHVGTGGIHTGFNIFGSEKCLWQNSAKHKSWHDLCQK